MYWYDVLYGGEYFLELCGIDKTRWFVWNIHTYIHTDLTITGKYKHLQDAEDKPLIEIIMAEKAEHLEGASAEDIEKAKQRKKKAVVKYVHYFLHAELQEGFSVSNFPRFANSNEQKTKYMVTELRKFLVALAVHPVEGITDLAGEYV